MAKEMRIPDKFQSLWGNKRFLLFYGGRGGAKSHSIGRFLLTKGAMEKARVLCGREYQTSIRDSVKSLMDDIIGQYPQLQYLYRSTRDETGEDARLR